MRLNMVLFLIISQIQFFFGQNEITTNKIDSIYKKFQTDELFNEEGFVRMSTLYHESKEINYIQGQLKTLQRMASIKIGSSSFKEAIKYNNEAKTLALITQNYDSYIASCFIETNIYISDHNYTQATTVLNDASNYLSKIEDFEKRRISQIAIDIQRWSIIHKSQSLNPSYHINLLQISQRIYKQALLIKDPQVRALRILFSSTWCASSLIEMGKIEEAENYLKIAENQTKIKGMDSFYTADYYQAKGDYEYKNKTENKFYLDSSLANYKKALNIAKRIEYTGLIKVLTPKLAKVYGEKGNYDHQKKYTEEAEEISNKLNTKINQNLDLAKPLLYKINDNTTKPEKKNSPYLFIILSIGIITLSILLFIQYCIKMKRINKEENDKYDTHLIKQPTKIISADLLLTLVKDKDRSFYLAFLKEYPEFSEKLLAINPTIKNSDIEFCALIKLNLDTKQIAIFKDMSVRAVEGKKYRIRKKLNITPDENMYIWMSKL